MSERCETCRFRSDDFYVVFGSLGRQSPCRRYPPADEKKGPLVDWRHWCGEWQAKREPVTDEALRKVQEDFAALEARAKQLGVPLALSPEPAKPKEREPGWYWVKDATDIWSPFYWRGDCWDGRRYDDSWVEIDERRIERAP